MSQSSSPPPPDTASTHLQVTEERPASRGRSASVQLRREADESELASLGRSLARTKRMYGSSISALLTLLPSYVAEGATDAEDDEDDTLGTRNTNEQANRELCTWMCNRSKALPALLDATDTQQAVAQLRQVARMIEVGRAEARNTDTRKLKEAVATNFGFEAGDYEWTPWEPVLVVKNKSTDWGYFHPQIGPLLTPQGKDWSDERVRSMLRSAGGTPQPTEWYPFMWADNKPMDNNLREGFLRGRLLIHSYNTVFFGMARNTRKRLTQPRSVARLMGLKSVTPASIAYIVTLLRFVLSSETRVDASFDHETFYDTLLSFLCHKDYASFVKDLLEWWDEEIFQVSAQSGAPTSTSTWAKMNAQTARSQSEHVSTTLRPPTSSAGQLRGISPPSDQHLHLSPAMTNAGDLTLVVPSRPATPSLTHQELPQGAVVEGPLDDRPDTELDGRALQETTNNLRLHPSRASAASKRRRVESDDEGEGEAQDPAATDQTGEGGDEEADEGQGPEVEKAAKGSKKRRTTKGSKQGGGRGAKKGSEK